MATAHDPVGFAAHFNNQLNWTHDDLYRWSLAQAEQCITAQAPITDETFAIAPSGNTPDAALARATDPAFWRKAAGRALRRKLSQLAQHRQEVGGATGQKYVSRRNAQWFQEAKERQAEWSAGSVILEKSQRQEALPLSAVMQTPEKLWAKTYTFIKGLQTVAVEDHSYQWFMATITLPGEFHANPVRGKNSWNGASPLEGYQVLTEGLKRMGARLEKEGIRKVGIGSEEPQQDETPHIHEGIFYEDDAAYWRYLEEYARQFPGPLKVIRGGGKTKTVTIFATLADVLSRQGSKGKQNDAGRVTITVGDAGAAAFASYMAKYISKNAGVQHGPETEAQASAKAVQAHRNAQGIRGWRFYGLPEGCLSGWDELRRVDADLSAPSNPLLAELTTLSKAGNAAEYLRKLGGLPAKSKPAEWVGLRLLTEERENRYGEAARRPVGVKLVHFLRERVRKPTGKLGKRGKPTLRTRTVITATTLDAVLTRFKRWEIFSEREAAGLQGFVSERNRAVVVTHNYPSNCATSADVQKTVTGLTAEKSTVVVSGAGSGKTHLLTERVRSLLDQGVPPAEVMVTTYTTKAAAELLERLDSKGITGITVGTMHSISYRMLGVREKNFDRMIELAAKLGKRRFTLLVDEAQDLNPAQLAWVKAHAKRLFVVADPNQAIYTFRGAVPDGVRQLHLHAAALSGETPDMFSGYSPQFEMLENRRSTHTVVALGNALSGAHAWTSRTGAPVQIVQKPSRQDELEAIANHAAGALVLTRTNRERLEVLATLAKRGVQPLDVMTIHAAKGKEADKVVLACGLLKDRQGTVDEEQRLSYVAVTRARSVLVITSTGSLTVWLETAIAKM